MKSYPFVSVIIPCRNEGRHIRRCMDSVLASDYPVESLEIIVVDGMSQDGTRTILSEYCELDPRVKVIDNDRITTPAGLNLGIIRAKGSVIVRMDAHSVYPTNYIVRLVQWLTESNADNVGGICVTRASADSNLATAIAVALAHPLGVGNAHFRLGVKEARWVDTVPFGCYHRSVFERVGLFDEELPRNQDDEFNARLRQAGGRILLVPDVQSEYYARGSLKHVWSMYYQYGLFKPLAVRKGGGRPTGRQLVPPSFVTALFVAGLLSAISHTARVVLIVLLLVYLTALTAAAVRISRTHGWHVASNTSMVFPCLHVSYGIGYLRGLFRMVFGNHNRTATHALPLSR